jgi:hypothetical protein
MASKIFIVKDGKDTHLLLRLCVIVLFNKIIESTKDLSLGRDVLRINHFEFACDRTLFGKNMVVHHQIRK